jgi:hypothetical protein
VLQTREMLVDAHCQEFSVLGGVPRRGIYDSEANKQTNQRIDCPPNRTAVDRVGVGKKRQVSARFAAMARPRQTPRMRVSSCGTKVVLCGAC